MGNLSLKESKTDLLKTGFPIFITKTSFKLAYWARSLTFAHFEKIHAVT